MIKVYGVPSCNKIKKTLQLLNDKKADYVFVNVKKEPIDKDKLLNIIKQISPEQLINRKGTTYRILGLKDKKLTDEELINIVLENQSIIKRPLLEIDESYMCGFDETEIVKFIKN